MSRGVHESLMRSSTDRILVSHAGNLPRPAYLDRADRWWQGPRRRRSARSTTSGCRRRVNEIVDKQIEHGVDIVNDGEYAKAGSYGGYIAGARHAATRRCRSIPTASRSAPAPPSATVASSPASTRPACGSPVRADRSGPASQRRARSAQISPREARACTAPITYIGQAAVAEDMQEPQSRAQGKDVEGYIAALGPLSLGAGVAQRVLQHRRGVHDGRRGRRARGVQGDHRRRPDRAGGRARVLHLLDRSTRSGASRSTASTSSSASRSSTTRCEACPRTRFASTPAGAAATARTSTTSSSSTSPT